MRCPYGGGLNTERASVCAQGGRDLPPVQARQKPVHVQPTTREQPQQSPFLPAPHPKPTTQGASRLTPPSQQPRPSQPATTPRQPPVVQQLPVSMPQPQQIVEPPVQFPPRTMTQLRELEAEAVPYTIADDIAADGRKKIVRIVYRRCAAWQQVATLLKAFEAQKQLETFTTIIVQGVLEQDKTPYAFTNGQLQFDRGVRLGSQTLNRYQIETGNGFENDSVRILLEEK
ncbi:MAG: hypothetical protein NVS9B9_18210 [Ktedonobacteraceae bacterium]